MTSFFVRSVDRCWYCYVFDGAYLASGITTFSDSDILFTLEASQYNTFEIPNMEDLNQDGMNDVLISNWRASDELNLAGAVYLFSGCDY